MFSILFITDDMQFYLATKFYYLSINDTFLTVVNTYSIPIISMTFVISFGVKQQPLTHFCNIWGLFNAAFLRQDHN